ncbi:tetratricopeptide repeat protein [Enterococcus dongliensis]|uniref:tetratricopeptide repeat protein n=1 Tax=Enterococcus dongliensis TaxID=2559925 RepID=UPI0028918549|nr:tetratricopeptide repeat protein [Enterococcus dongliensis]MDT2614267.1 tetratricopeptide repeat protein [Enterococcus dongliensis]
MQKKKKSEVEKEPIKELTVEEKSALNEKVERLSIEMKELEATSPKQVEKLAKVYEEIGLVQAKLEQIDSAIVTLEKSLATKETIGDGYKKLMSLYNAKRAEAARNGDDAGIDKYMGKMDEMRQIAKKVTISGQ